MDTSVEIKQSRKDIKETAKTGFDEIRAALKRSFLKPILLFGLSDCLFTLGSRQSWKFGFDALSSKEKNIFEYIKVNNVFPMQNENPEGMNVKGRLFVGLRKYGRSFIEDYNSEMNSVSEYFGYINLSEKQRRRLRDIVKSSDETTQLHAQVVVSYFKSLSADEYKNMLSVVKHGIDHIDPILIYTHRSVFTTFAGFNNLLGKNSKPRYGMLLDDLMAGNDRKLNSDEMEFLYCFYVLKQGGFRGEEFCGLQLTCKTLRNYLSSKISTLSALDCESNVALTSSDLIEMAKVCKQLKDKISKDYFVYRKINGLCFYKNERYNLRSVLDFSTNGLPVALTGYIEDTYGVSSGGYVTIDDYFTEVVKRAAENYDVGQEVGLNSIEILLKFVVQSAIEELDSGIGMTRGFRDLLKLHNGIEMGAEEEICGYPSTDYFCAVFLSVDVKELFLKTPGLCSRVATAIAGRMTFNSWHYMPGQFAEANSDGIRHFYVPPRMTDSAAWSDQHHPGHVLAQVRYAIRSPASLMIAGKKRYGIIDLRLMRQTGLPYSDGEIMRAKEYSSYLKSIYQAVINYSVQNNRALTVDAFDGKEWYMRYDS